MPAYVQHHDIEQAPMICPSCIGLLPMFVRDVEPHWSMTKIDFTYECSDCGTEIKKTVVKPAPRLSRISSRSDRARQASVT